MAKAKWKKVEKGALVVVDGAEYEVKKVGDVKGKLTATLSGDAGFLRIPVKPDDKVTLAEPETEEERTAREATDRKLAQGIRTAKREHHEMLANVEKKKARERAEKGASWNKPEDKAEARVTDILGAKLLGVETPREGLFQAPPLDPSTIKSHLFILHGVDAGLSSYDDLVRLHNEEHARERSFPIPHEHVSRRPA